MKLSNKELDALSSVIYTKINKARAEKLQKKLEEDKEYLKLLTDVEAFNKEIGKLVDMQAKLDQKAESIEKRMGLSYASSSHIGYLDTDKIFHSCKESEKYRIVPTTNSVYTNQIKDSLILKNIGGELNVDKFVDEMVKQFI